MGNKKKRYPALKPDEKELLLDPGDDPYWKVSQVSYDPRKGAKELDRFRRYSNHYSQWVEEIISGYPSYYGVLHVLKGTTADELRKAYERELKISAFPNETIEEAYRVLSDLQLRVKYHEFLSVFEKASLFFQPDTKEELVNKHDGALKHARNIRKLQGYTKLYYDYILLIGAGMPDIFMYSGLKPDCSEEEAQLFADEEDELSILISSILIDPLKREQFVFISEFIANNSHEERERLLTILKEVWDSYDPQFMRKVLLFSLTTSERTGDVLGRIGSISSLNHDWIQYLPPSEKTFFSILGVDETICSLTKGEMDTLLRARYRTLERTPEVNLAYTILKSPNLRNEYLWILKHYELKRLEDILNHKFFEDEEEEEEDEEEEFERVLLEAMKNMQKRFGDRPSR